MKNLFERKAEISLKKLNLDYAKGFFKKLEEHEDNFSHENYRYNETAVIRSFYETQKDETKESFAILLKGELIGKLDFKEITKGDHCYITLEFIKKEYNCHAGDAIKKASNYAKKKYLINNFYVKILKSDEPRKKFYQNLGFSIFQSDADFDYFNLTF